MAGTLCVLYDTETGTQGTGGADTGTEDDRATACGKGTVAGLVATAIGTNAEASGGRAVALGYDSHATSSDTIAIGVNSHASGPWSLALGGGSQGPAFGASALGASRNATGRLSTATGVYSQANSENSLALGRFLGLPHHPHALITFTKDTASRAIPVGQPTPAPATK